LFTRGVSNLPLSRSFKVLLPMGIVIISTIASCQNSNL
jgi:hypothetical protein